MLGTDKQALIVGAQLHKTDTGSPRVQIAVLSTRIKELTEHLKVHKKDFAARRGLLQMVGLRRRLERYSTRTDEAKPVTPVVAKVAKIKSKVATKTKRA